MGAKVCNMIQTDSYLCGTLDSGVYRTWAPDVSLLHGTNFGPAHRAPTITVQNDFNHREALHAIQRHTTNKLTQV
jgi:hypothetical protein